MKIKLFGYVIYIVSGECDMYQRNLDYEIEKKKQGGIQEGIRIAAGMDGELPEQMATKNTINVNYFLSFRYQL